MPSLDTSQVSHRSQNTPSSCSSQGSNISRLLCASKDRLMKALQPNVICEREGVEGPLNLTMPPYWGSPHSA